MNKLLFLFILISTTPVYSAAQKYFENKTSYKTVFGQCPSKIVGRLTLSLIKEFEKSNSLLDVKKKIIDEKLEEKYYLSSYKIKYNPLQKMLRFEYDCPRPLMNVQIYKKDGEEFYTAVLTENGKLYDPTYEVLLRSEKLLKGSLPHMAIPVSLINSNIHMKLTSMLNGLGDNFRKDISEVILNEKKELTIILSVGRRPSSAFFGQEYWSEKVSKLEKIMNTMKKKKTIPAVINLTNSKKIVVKFSDTI
ncbi:MAG: hypothetical protein CME62_02890 [Halobacteriovoraceae bacterium]|nr:hypothetical protein [Halobacteriovoraceae bacterium]|tara:strand:- start:12 stop:758 length:747 start_codon:yes stop_codon:yes gene_type:complete